MRRLKYFLPLLIIIFSLAIFLGYKSLNSIDTTSFENQIEKIYLDQNTNAIQKDLKLQKLLSQTDPKEHRAAILSSYTQAYNFEDLKKEYESDLIVELIRVKKIKITDFDWILSSNFKSEVYVEMFKFLLESKDFDFFLNRNLILGKRLLQDENYMNFLSTNVSNNLEFNKYLIDNLEDIYLNNFLSRINQKLVIDYFMVNLLTANNESISSLLKNPSEYIANYCEDIYWKINPANILTTELGKSYTTSLACKTTIKTCWENQTQFCIDGNITSLNLCWDVAFDENQIKVSYEKLNFSSDILATASVETASPDCEAMTPHKLIVDIQYFSYQDGYVVLDLPKMPGKLKPDPLRIYIFRGISFT